MFKEIGLINRNCPHCGKEITEKDIVDPQKFNWCTKGKCSGCGVRILYVKEGCEDSLGLNRGEVMLI